METETGIFLRKASGLRRSASALDIFIFDTGLISIGLAVALNAYYIPAFYPSASIVTASLIGTVLMVLAGIGFYLWAVVLPRSGGNYVFVSRALNPWIGFVVSWLEIAVLLFYTAVAAAYIVRIGLATLVGSLGVSTGIGGLVNIAGEIGKPVPTFMLGAAIIAISSYLLFGGMRSFFAVQKAVFFVAIAGTIALFAGFFYLGHVSVFHTLQQTFPGWSASNAISLAQARGWSLAPVSIDGSLAAIGWPLLPLAGGVLSIGIGAEIQRVKRSQLVGIIGSILFSGVVFALLGWLSESVFSRQLLGAIGFNATNGAMGGVPGGIAWIPFLVAALVHKWWFALLIGGGFVAWIYLWIPGMLAYCNRTFLAWSLDRVGPAWLGAVDENRHTPTNSSIVGALVAILFLGAYIWVPPLQSLVVFQVLMFTWGLSLAGGALFPFLRQRLYAASTAGGAVIGSRRTFTILMALGSIALLYSGYVLWNDPISAGHSPLAIAVILGLVITGALAYLVAIVVRKHQGIDLTRLYKELPIE